MIEESIKYLLEYSENVRDITTRCYPVKIPQGPTYPLIVYTKITGIRDHVLKGSTGHAHPRFQIEAWAKTYAEVKALAVAIREALDGFSGTVEGVHIGSCLIETERDIYETEIEVYRVVQDWMIWHEE